MPVPSSVDPAFVSQLVLSLASAASLPPLTTSTSASSTASTNSSASTTASASASSHSGNATSVSITVSGNHTITLSSNSTSNSTSTASSTTTQSANLTTAATPTELISITAYAPGQSASGIALGPNDGYIAGSSARFDLSVWASVGAAALGFAALI
ncbi:SPOSA6832_00108, partial [Sporobolomyces salmonicolor]